MKKITAIILAAFFIAAAVITSAAAVVTAGGDIYPYEYEKTLLSDGGEEHASLDDGKMNIVIDGGLSELRAKAGETVDVAVRLINNPA